MYSDTQLKTMSKKIGVSLTDVVCKDQLITQPKNGNFIVNMQSSHDCITHKWQSGSHWLGIVALKNIVYFSDSFGFPPPQEVLKFIGKRPYIYNNKQIQNITSHSCGMYALCFIFWMNHLHGNPLQKMKQYQDMFDIDTTKNLKILKAMFQHLVDTYK